MLINSSVFKKSDIKNKKYLRLYQLLQDQFRQNC